MLGQIAVVVVAVEHLGIMVLEMFLWTKPIGRRIFGLTPELAQSSRVLAANQGLYAGFAAQVFFLSCVIVAGIFGAITAKRSILWTQGLPAAIALLLVWIR